MVAVVCSSISELSEDDRHSASTFNTKQFDKSPAAALSALPSLVSGTTIATLAGELPIETLKPGDKIITRDFGAVPLGWIGRSQAIGKGTSSSILIKAGAIGNHADLMVSPNQCVLLLNPVSELFFGTNTVLVPAEYLIDGQSIRLAEQDDVEHWHLLFDRHHVIYAGGAMVETLYPDRETVMRVRTSGAMSSSCAKDDIPFRPKDDLRSAARILDRWEAQLLLSKYAELMSAPIQDGERVH